MLTGQPERRFDPRFRGTRKYYQDSLAEYKRFLRER